MAMVMSPVGYVMESRALDRQIAIKMNYKVIVFIGDQCLFHHRGTELNYKSKRKKIAIS